MVKSLPANAGDTGDAVLIPESGSYSGVGNGNLLQYSTLGNPMVRGAWWAIAHGVTRVKHDLAPKAPLPQILDCALEPRSHNY